MGTTVRPVRFRDDELVLVGAAVAASGRSFNQWVRAACVRVAELERAVVAMESRELVHERLNAANVGGRRARASLCPHRVPAGAFCKVCD